MLIAVLLLAAVIAFAARYLGQRPTFEEMGYSLSAPSPYGDDELLGGATSEQLQTMRYRPVDLPKINLREMPPPMPGQGMRI